MFPYWLFYSFVTLGVLGRGARRAASSHTSPLLLTVAAAITLFIGLRYEVGGDWENYQDILSATPDDLALALSYGDWAYMYLNWQARQFGFDIWFVNLCCAIIFVLALLKFASEEPNPWLTLLVSFPYLILVVAMGYTRQSVAIALTLLVVMEMRRENFVRAAIYLVFALMFHRTAIVVLPLIALSVVRYRIGVWVASIVGGIALLTFLFERFLSRFVVSYIDSGMSSEGAGVRVALNVVPAVLFLLLGKRFVTTRPEYNLWRNYSLAALAAAAALALLSASTLVDRLALYLVPLQLVVLGRLPYVLSGGRQSPGPLIMLVVVTTAAIQFTWLNYATHAHAWLPYRFTLTGYGLPL